ncbi:MAG: MFS transporter [Clostridiales bacterium]|nr:MFS transporter [Clostridiales bacterium]
MILINFSIGSVYCWTLFKEDIISYTGFSKSVTEWCFSLAIFCLGMSAAFGGKIVEKDVKKSTLITFITFTLGWIVTGFGIQMKSAFLTVLGFGVIQGIGLGFGYITPVKTLMIWMDKNKGLAAGLSIGGFALAGVLVNPLIAFFLGKVPVYVVFYVLAGIFGACIFAAYLLIYRPEAVDDREEFQRVFKIKEIIFTKKFILLWLVFFLNITCGLALISQEKQVYCSETLGIVSIALVVIFCNISALMNLVGRLSMASWQDRLKRKHVPYFVMAISSLLVCFVASFASDKLMLTLITMWTVNFFFGCGFSCMPNILHQHYGLNQFSTVQGLSLSAWAVAGLVGNQLSLFIMHNYSLSALYLCLGIIYSVMLGLLLVWNRISFKKQA